MDAERLVAAVERFFLDIIGSVLPGAFLLIGLWVAFRPAAIGPLALRPPDTTADWLLFLGASYVLGHAIVSVGERYVRPAAVKLAKWLRRIPIVRLLAPSGLMNEDAMWEAIARRETTKRFLDYVAQGTSRHMPAEEVRNWRNTAMTMSRPEDRATAVRLRFQAQLNLGIATVLWVVPLVLLVTTVVGAIRSDGMAEVGFATARGLLFLVFGVLLSLLFLERDARFLLSSLRLPFDTGLGALQQTPRHVSTPPTEGLPTARTASLPASASMTGQAPDRETSSRRLAVYLAGGLHSGWQERVRAEIPGADYLDPRTHRLRDPSAYTAWDLDALRRSDVVFAYLEDSNPGGYALALEIGFARALDKHVILVNAQVPAQSGDATRLAMIQATVDVNTTSFEEGLQYLGLYVEARRRA